MGSNTPKEKLKGYNAFNTEKRNHTGGDYWERGERNRLEMRTRRKKKDDRLGRCMIFAISNPETGKPVEIKKSWKGRGRAVSGS